MKVWKQLMAGCAFAAAATLLLSILPQFERSVAPRYRNDIAVFQPAQVTRIGQSNLVDALIGLSLKNRIKTVDWNHAVLAVDFTVGRSVRANQVNADLLELLRLSYIQTENVNRILVRFFEEEPDPSAGQVVKLKLMMSADVRKSDRDIVRYLPALQPGDLLRKEWRERFRISYTTSWEERYGVQVE